MISLPVVVCSFIDNISSKHGLWDNSIQVEFNASYITRITSG